jgi:hypothetical protein
MEVELKATIFSEGPPQSAQGLQQEKKDLQNLWQDFPAVRLSMSRPSMLLKSLGSTSDFYKWERLGRRLLASGNKDLASPIKATLVCIRVFILFCFVFL